MTDDCCGASHAPVGASLTAVAVTAAVPHGAGLTRLRIAQMDCPTDETLIRKKLGGVIEMQGLEFNLMQRVLTVVRRSDLPTIQAAIRELGRHSQALDGAGDKASGGPEPTKPWWPFVVSGSVAISAEILSWSGMPEWRWRCLPSPPSPSAVMHDPCCRERGSTFHLHLLRLEIVEKPS